MNTNPKSLQGSINRAFRRFDAAQMRLNRPEFMNWKHNRRHIIKWQTISNRWEKRFYHLLDTAH